MADTQPPTGAIKADNRSRDSDYGSSVDSDTFSLTSSLSNYLERNGRLYHTYFGLEKNPMPNDTIEQERLDKNHELIVFLFGGKFYLAPVNQDKQVHRALDLGTGTGLWAVEFAYQNPQAEVVGIDLSPIQPTWVPPNCRFEIDDMELEWNFKSPFDYINARMLMQSINDWLKLLGQAMAHMNPGAWFEMGEIGFEPKCDDGTMPDDWPPVILFNHMRRAFNQLGRIIPTAPKLRSILEEGGFTDVTVKIFKIPSGTWPKNPHLKQAGAFLAHLSETGYEAYMLALCTRVLRMEEEEIVRLCRASYQAQVDSRKDGIHTYWDYYAAYGRKS